MFEGLLPAGRLDELRKVIDERRAYVTEKLGPDSLASRSTTSVLASADASHGDLPGARAAIDRASAVVAKAYPDGKTLRNVEVLRTRAEIEVVEGKAKEARATYEQALALAKQLDPKPIVEIAQIADGLANVVAQMGDRDAAIKAFEDAIAAARAESNDSMPLAMLLLNYGQVIGDTDFEAGLRTFEEARQILVKRKDPRAAYTSAAMAVIESRTNRWADARRHAEEAIEFSSHDPDAYPQNTAELQTILARAAY